MKGSILISIEHFQNLIIGSGVAGKILAWTLASQGQKTVVIERAEPAGRTRPLVATHGVLSEEVS